MTNANRGSVILAIDPGTRFMGVAVLDGGSLIYHGVKILPHTESPVARLSYAATELRVLIRKFKPGILAVESAFLARDVNAALLNMLVDEICCVGKEERVAVRTLAPSTVRKRLRGNGRATKREVAEVVAARYPKLRVYLTKDQAWEERYYGNMFDAVAVGMVATSSTLPRCQRAELPAVDS